MPTINSLKPQFRELNIKGFDEENRTIELSFSSEDPYERYFGIEILDHATASVDLSRLNNSGALLFNHDRNIVAGVVESATIDNKRGVAVVRFGNSEKANEIFKDVVDGILTKVSVGYLILEMKLESENDGIDTYRVTKWQPYEISIVSIPADDTVGVGRDADLVESEVVILNQKKEAVMPEEKEVDVKALEKAARDGERERVREIGAIAKKHKIDDEGQKAIDDGSTLEEFRILALQKIGVAKPVSSKNLEVLSDAEVKGYSFSKAITAAITGNWENAQDERAASDKVAKMLGHDSRGFYIPHQILQREITTTTGASTVTTTDGGANFIGLLRNKLMLLRLGAKLLTGLSGNVSIPKQTGSATAYWIDEGADTTASDLTLGSLEMTPKTVSGKTGYTRKMLLQGNPDIEMLVMDDLATSIALAIDAAGFNGTGATGQPTGILNTTGIGAVTMTTVSGGLTNDKTIDLETKIAEGNADVETMHYVAGAAVTGKLKKKPVEAGHPTKILSNGEVNGYKHNRTNQVPANALMFGDFSQVVIAMWGGLDIMIDQFTNADSGGVLIRAFQSVDIGVRYAQAFSASIDVNQ